MAGIDSNAFKSDKSIAIINFGSRCKSVGDSAFQGCTSLQEINTDNVIESIGKYAFASTGLESAAFSKLILLSTGAFMDCSKLTTVNTKPLNDIPSESFRNCTKLKDFNFENCKNIGSFSFNKCVSLEKINLYICESIDNNAFGECSELKEVYINNIETTKCKLNNTNAFSNTHNDITFYFKPETLGSYYFDDIWDEFNDKMKYIQQNNQIIYTTSNKKNINGSINYQDNQYNNNELNYGWITFNNKVETLDLNIFNMDDESRGIITHIQIPPECVYIGDNLFEDCTQLKEIKLSDTLKDIGAYTFKNCEKLKSFEIPESVDSLGEGSFAGCIDIEGINSESKKIIADDNYIAFNNTLICVLPKKVNKIYQIIKDITRIGNSCFHGCENMKCIDIPNTIKQIGANVFEGCKNLRVIHFNSNTPPDLDGKLFGEDEKLVPDTNDFIIFVPNGSGDDYKKAYVYYADYIHEISNGDEANNGEAFVTSDGNVIKVKITQEGEEKNVFGVKLS